MRHLKFKWILYTMTLMISSSCINSDYDLSNIDTMSEFKVNDFIIPMKMDKITLDCVLDIPEDSKLQKVTFERDGQQVTEYAVIEEGTFNSQTIDIPSFISEKPEISPTRETLTLIKSDLLNNLQQIKKRTPGGQLLAYCNIPSDVKPEFSVKATSISKYIKDIDNIGVTAHINVSFSLLDIDRFVNQFHIEDLTLQFPEGLEMTPSQGTYDSSTGVLTLGNITSQSPSTLSVEADITRIYDKAFEYTENNDKTHTLIFEDNVYVKTGAIRIYTSDIKENLSIYVILQTIPDEIVYECRSDISKVTGNDLTGKVEYDFEGIDINPIEITGLPEVLQQSGTKINLTNPQIYLEINNVLSDYNVYAQAGLDLTSTKNGKQNTYSLDNQSFKISDKNNILVMSPKVPEYYYPGYENAEHIGFASLSRVLDSGEGIPDAIDVTITNPGIPEQQINKFELGKELGSVNGKYLLYAPLNLTDESLIVYTDTIKGWNDEDVDGIIINKLSSMFNITTDVPCDIELQIHPMVINEGDDESKIDENIYGVTTIEANSKGVYKEIDIEGKIEHLDGIFFKAIIKGKNDECLSPDMNIILENLKAKVTGRFIKEL